MKYITSIVRRIENILNHADRLNNHIFEWNIIHTPVDIHI